LRRGTLACEYASSYLPFWVETLFPTGSSYSLGLQGERE